MFGSERSARTSLSYPATGQHASSVSSHSLLAPCLLLSATTTLSMRTFSPFPCLVPVPLSPPALCRFLPRDQSVVYIFSASSMPLPLPPGRVGVLPLNLSLTPLLPSRPSFSRSAPPRSLFSPPPLFRPRLLFILPLRAISSPPIPMSSLFSFFCCRGVTLSISSSTRRLQDTGRIWPESPPPNPHLPLLNCPLAFFILTL